MATVGERAGSTMAAGGPVGGPSPTAPGTGGESGRGWSFPVSSAPRGSARSTRSTGTAGPRRSRTSAARVIFEQTDCEIPRALEPARHQRRGQQVLLRRRATATAPERENASSVRQLVDRVTRTIADWGRDDGYFATDDDAERFYDELTSLCVNQYGSFNSPVWFNVGLFHRYGIAGPANN